ncbi:28S rRNA (cytosine-C(5))-methyltransferase isoform X2 [Frieseomelitta varia]|uniref:28S rRNA (cytosine-C(5))-methyltransferase isoform X2 n=1 Tax=Frieseomelitta varia TaxID=561572 RepID=UPI001CB68836|nr:28S rRNA (cytosine-C(5))-methyltransferase isoform X2 [Frieseomelitta varia]
MPNRTVHSIKVPRLYKTAAKIVQEVREKHGSLKTLIYEGKHPNVSGIYALCYKTLAKETQLTYLLNKIKILINEPGLDPWLARILVTELLWGKKTLKSECKPIQTVLAYEQKLRELSNIDDVERPRKTVKKPRYVRINTLLLPLEKGISYFQEEGWHIMPKCSNYIEYLDAVKKLKQPNFIQDFHIPELLVFPSNTIFYKHSKYQSGEIVLQDKASCLSSYLLNPTRGSVVLDMCAAPGMKTSHLAAIMENTGKICAVEVNEFRYQMLCKTIKLTGASCVETVHKDALTLKSDEYPNVEYILVDPTCSGSGMLDRQKLFGKEKYDPIRLKKLQAFQVLMLRHALLNFPNVKKVVYSTCSTCPEENEQVVSEILENVQNAYKLLPAKELLNGNWLNFSSKIYNCSDKCLYIKSNVDLCNDFFIAVFERDFDVPLPKYKEKKPRQQVASNNQGKKQIDVLHAENANTTRKLKKLGKRKKKNEETKDNILIDSVLNASSDSIEFIQEVKNDSDDNTSQNNDSVDIEPVIKKRKKKISSMMMKLPRNRFRLSQHKELRSQKKKRKIV